MNTSEIVDRYERKHTSISVLAELNDCKPKEIRDILKDAGVLNKQNIKMPMKLKAAHQKFVKDIEEEINVHKSAAVAEKMEITNERNELKRQFKEIYSQYKEFEEIRKNNIQIHKNAVEILENEKKELEEFYKMFS